MVFFLIHHTNRPRHLLDPSLGCGAGHLCRSESEAAARVSACPAGFVLRSSSRLNRSWGTMLSPPGPAGGRDLLERNSRAPQHSQRPHRARKVLGAWRQELQAAHRARNAQLYCYAEPLRYAAHRSVVVVWRLDHAVESVSRRSGSASSPRSCRRWSSAGAGLARPSSFHEHSAVIDGAHCASAASTSLRVRGVRRWGEVGGGMERCQAASGRLGQVWFWRPVRPEPTGRGSLLGRGRVAGMQPNPVPPYPNNRMGRPNGKTLLRALVAARPRESGRYLARGMQEWASMTASPTPNAPHSSCRSWAPKLQALNRCPRWSWICGVLALCSTARERNQSDVGPACGFSPGSPSLEQYSDSSWPWKICSTLGWTLVTRRGLARQLRPNCIEQEGPSACTEQAPGSRLTLFLQTFGSAAPKGVRYMQWPHQSNSFLDDRADA